MPETAHYRTLAAVDPPRKGLPTTRPNVLALPGAPPPPEPSDVPHNANRVILPRDFAKDEHAARISRRVLLRLQEKRRAGAHIRRASAAGMRRAFRLFAIERQCANYKEIEASFNNDPSSIDLFVDIYQNPAFKTRLYYGN